MDEGIDVIKTLESTLDNKQEMVRAYQLFADKIEDHSVSEMFRRFAESEGLQAHQIIDKLEDLK